MKRSIRVLGFGIRPRATRDAGWVGGWVGGNSTTPRVAGETATWQGNNNERAGLTHTRPAKSRTRERRGFINRGDGRRSSDTSADDGEKRAAKPRAIRPTYLSRPTRKSAGRDGGRRLKTRDSVRRANEQSADSFPPDDRRPFALRTARERSTRGHLCETRLSPSIENSSSRSVSLIAINLPRRFLPVLYFLSVLRPVYRENNRDNRDNESAATSKTSGTPVFRYSATDYIPPHHIARGSFTSGPFNRLTVLGTDLARNSSLR